ncbi:unnamed protein product [Clonostachys rhizophaga]|uniref:Uncharacterized protein n=1 Tax=Clonostachys rhizophaga TaxID=160324 RepID=A0A9N9VQL8_9HYPO|nr:unnamed protein product [Clonostachys rhizophaga]
MAGCHPFGALHLNKLDSARVLDELCVVCSELGCIEAVYYLIFCTFTVTVPFYLNGAASAELRTPFPVIARSGYGFYFSRVPVVVIMATALFWHAIQTYSGSTNMIQIIRAIWPSYLNISNHLPASAGITTQQMVSHFLFWSVQFPILLIPPHKIRGGSLLQRQSLFLRLLWEL